MNKMLCGGSLLWHNITLLVYGHLLFVVMLNPRGGLSVRPIDLVAFCT